MSNEVHALGHTPGKENDFICRLGISARAASRVSSSACRTFSKRMDPAMDVGIISLVVVDQTLDHLTRFLGGRRIVEVCKSRPLIF